ncbi:CoB--CoM heterodisulfide reductase iron-sulfur subunit A family protein, partial [Candidatus Woesearchaeota archaeon]|nr:CoB--CoM heterodisulfide reductase iron-sulfur subunit A family protein [Candidatus Woesearchaeota archaeon]
MKEEIVELEVGSIIVATGIQPFEPTPLVQYGYGRFENVYTSLEFERLNHAAGPTGGKIQLKDGRQPESVAIIHCVGSRDKNYHPYCSRVCCMYSLKFAHLVREKVPEAQVYEFYIDMRCFGKRYEEFYNRMLEEDIRFIRARAAEVLDFAIYDSEKGKLVIRCEDTLVAKIRRIPVDMVILSVALEARKDAANIAKLFSISADKDGFFIEKHPKLDPIATMTDGVFIAGCCQGPKDIPDTVAQGQAAAACALSMISRGVMEIEPITSQIDRERCAGCRICEAMCPYGAIEYKSEEKVCQVNEVVC